MSQESLNKRVKVHKTSTTTTTTKTPAGIRSSDASDSVEFTAICLPTLEDGSGPVALGDLWNCRTNTVEGNLFEGPLLKEHMQADPIQSLDYTYRSCKSTKDVVDIMKVEASLALDYAGSGGTSIKVTGSGSYANDEKTNFREESIVVDYNAMTYQVRVRPSASDVVSERIKKLLLKKDGADPTIIATHFVQAVLVGGKATGSIKYKENVSDSKMEIKGEFQLEATFGSIDINAQAKFEKLDTEFKEDYETTIEVHAQPRLEKSPTTCEEMFAQIKLLDTLTDRERHYPELDKPADENGYINRVTGVPLKFRLVPIAHIVEEVDVDPLFKLLTEELMADYSAMLFTLRDYSNAQHIKMLLCEMKPSVIPILMDDLNEITAEIAAYAKDKAALARELRQEATQVYITYKTAGGGPNPEAPLLQMFNKYQNTFNLEGIVSDLQDFAKKAKQELAAVRSSDVNGIEDDEGRPAIKFFMNKIDLDEWFATERTIKILLRTDYTETAPVGIFLRLYDMAPALYKSGVEVGVAFPSASEGHFDLQFKTQFLNTTYERNDIRFFLEVLEVAVDEGETIKKLFYSLNGALSGLNLPMHDYLFDAPNLTIVMSEFKGTIISETYCDLLARLMESIDTWNIVIPIQALNTSVEMMRFFRQLRVYIPQRYPGLKHRFLIGRFNNVSDKFYSPLLLLFRDNVFQAVCLDQLDILIMMEQFGKEVPDLSLLEFSKIRESCLYPPRADWAISVIQNLILDHQTSNTDPIADLPEFPNQEDPDLFLQSAMEVTRASAMRDEPDVLTTLAKLSLADEAVTDALEAVLAMHGWKDGQFSQAVWKRIDWEQFDKDMKDFLASQAPFLYKVVLALDELKNMKLSKLKPEEPEPEEPGEGGLGIFNQIMADEEDISDEELNAMIDKIIAFLKTLPDGTRITYTWRGRKIEEEEIYKELKAQVLAYDGMPPKVRRVGIMKLFEKFIAKEASKPELFHIFHLTSLIEGKADPEFKSLKHILLPMCRKYCARLFEQIDDDAYPRGKRRLEDSLVERQLFKTLGVLSEIRYHPKLYVIHQELFNFSVLPAPVNVKSVIEKMSIFEEGDGIEVDDQLETIWTNPKFLYALRQVAGNEGVLESLYVLVYKWNERQNAEKMIEETENLLLDEEYEEVEVEAIGDDGDLEFPYWIPPDIVEKVRMLINLRQRPNYPYPKEWTEVALMIEAFQIVYTRQVVAMDFPEVLLKNVQEQSGIKKELEDLQVLFYWNEGEELFDMPWSLDTVTRALNALKVKHPDEEPFKMERKLLQIQALEKPKAGDPLLEEKLIVNTYWKRLVRNGSLDPISYKNFLELDTLNPTALTEYDELEKTGGKMLRYFRQQLKMKNGSALSASFFEKYINYPPPGARPGMIDFGEGIIVKNFGFFLTRGDMQTLLFHLTDPVVTHFALMSMAKSPIPLPLLVTSVEQQPIPKNADPTPTKSILLAPALRDIIIPEMEGLVPQPRLFRDPYRFVLTLRVGDTGDEIGRSSLINQHLMGSSTFYSSKLDPGSSSGRPMNRNGFVEFSWLSESTCDSVFWENKVLPEYLGQRKETILMGLLHGDALTMPSLFEVLRPFVSCFVVFWKVSNYNDLKTKKKALTQLIGTKEKVLDVVLYPDATIVEKIADQNLIFKQVQGGTQEIHNKNKLMAIFEVGIAYTVHTSQEFIRTSSEAGGREELPSPTSSSFLSSIASGLSGVPKGAKPLSTNLPIQVTPVRPVSTKESKQLLGFIGTHSIGNIQDAIKDGNPALVAKLVELFVAILNLPEDQEIKSLTHITWELDYLSRMSRGEFVERLQKLRAQIEDKFTQDGERVEEKWILEVQQEVKMSLENIRRNTMTLQDLWRVMRTWTTTTAPGIPAAEVEFFKNGFPIEMFHPTYLSESIWGHGIDEVLKLVEADTRILVVSAIGLKSSGKSSLLNSLFGMGFTEHGSTFGVQMRIVWLNKELTDKLDCDAFIIIDSEGVGAAENKIDDNADELERRICTLLLSTSSVTLATVLGAQMNELKDILEISMSSLGKINEIQSTPDVFLVQAYLPGQTAGGSVPTDFSACLSSSVKLTTELELQMGVRVTQAHRLKQIKSREKHGEVVHKLRSRGSLQYQTPEFLEYQTDIQKLYGKIIYIGEVTRGSRLRFGDWVKKTKKLWEEIRPIPIPFRSSSVAAVTDVVAFEENVSKVKKAIDDAFAHHERVAEGEFNARIDKLFAKYEKPFDGKLELELSALVGKLHKVVNGCDEMALDTLGAGARRRRKLRATMTAEPNPNSCFACAQAFRMREELLAKVVKQKRGFLVDEDLTRYTNTVRDSIYERLRQGLIARQIAERQSDGDLFLKLAKIMEDDPGDEGKQWGKFLQYVSTLLFVIPARHRFHAELQEVYKNLEHVAKSHLPDGPQPLPDLKGMIAFDVQIYNSALESAMNPRKPEMLSWLQHDWLLARLQDIPKQMKEDYEAKLYKVGMSRDLQSRIHKTILLFEEYCGEHLLPNFKWQVHLYAIQLFSIFIADQQEKWDLRKLTYDENDTLSKIEGGNPLVVLRHMKDDFIVDDGFFREPNE